MKKRIACLLLSLALMLTPLAVSAATLGTVPADAAFDVTVSAPSCYAKGDIITVDIIIENITAVNGLSYISAELQYNPAQLLLKTELTAADRDLNCLAATPASDWENLSHVTFTEGTDGYTVANDGVINLQALTVNMDNTTYAKADGSIKFSVKFEVLAQSGDVELYIAHADIKGAANTTAGFDLYTGKGSSDTVKAHVFTDYVSNGDATATEDGTKTATCDNGCGTLDTVTDEGSATGKTALLGDVDFDGDIDAADYTLVKRYVLKTVTFSDDQFYAGDVNQNGIIDATDYTLVKRHVLKTYTIVQPQA